MQATVVACGLLAVSHVAEGQAGRVATPERPVAVTPKVDSSAAPVGRKKGQALTTPIAGLRIAPAPAAFVAPTAPPKVKAKPDTAAVKRSK